MKNSTKLFALVLVAAAAMFGGVQSAQAQAFGNTAVSVNVNGIVILYYYSTVNVTLPAALLGTAVNEGTVSPTATAVTGGAQATLATLPTGSTALSNINLDILNAWAVRALNTAGANTQVTIGGASNTLTAGGTNVITIAGRQVRAGSGAFATPSIQFPSAGTFTAPQTGDVRLALDLTAVSAIGNFTGGNYTLTAVNM